MKLNLKNVLKQLHESGDTYYDSAKGIKIDKKRAEQELKRQGHEPNSPEWKETMQLFFGKGQTKIDAQKFLAHLGY